MCSFLILIFSWFSIAYFYEKAIERESFFDTLLLVLWIAAIFIFTFLIYQFIFEEKLRNSLYAPIGIIISAFIASASVMKSIQNSKEIENEKSEGNEREKVWKYYQEVMKNIKNKTSKESIMEVILLIKVILDSLKLINDDTFVYSIKKILYTELNLYISNSKKQDKVLKSIVSLQSLVENHLKV